MQKKALSAILHREVENLLSEVEDVKALFNGATSITLPISIHQDMINALLLEWYLANEQAGDGKNFSLDLIKNGVQFDKKDL